MTTHKVCATITPFTIKRKGFSDLTGAFPHNSSRGNVYAMFMYDYYSNAILDEPIKNRQAASICVAFLKIHKVIKARGSEPKIYIMDKECFRDLKETMGKYE